MITEKQETELNEIIGEHAPSPTNVNGVSFYFDEGEEFPYRIGCEHENESFATYEELVDATKSWKESLDNA